MPSLGGSIFVRNAIDLDYCIQESLASLCAVCDQVVVLDCQSEDNTLLLLLDSARQHSNLQVIRGAQWDCADNFMRLSMLANLAKSYLDTDWHFMLQADEVLHENSFPHIHRAIKSGVYDSFMSRRINFFGDFNHHLGFDIPNEEKPVNDVIFRLATMKYDAHDDAEGTKIDPATCSGEYLDQIQIFHYGFVRDDRKHIDKILSMQSWFWGPNSTPDSRAVEAKAAGDPFDWQKFKSRDLLRKFTGTHPKFAEKWIAERQARKVPVE